MIPDEEYEEDYDTGGFELSGEEHLRGIWLVVVLIVAVVIGGTLSYFWPQIFAEKVEEKHRSIEIRGNVVQSNVIYDSCDISVGNYWIHSDPQFQPNIIIGRGDTLHWNAGYQIYGSDSIVEGLKQSKGFK